MATLTVHTTLALDAPAHAPLRAALDAWAEVTGRCQRALHAGRMTGQTTTALKPGLMRRFGLTARQFNGLRIDYDGKLSAARIAQRRHLDRLARQQARNTERLASARRHHAAEVVHQLARRGATLAARHARAEAALQRPPALCFGSARLFRAQHQLAANGFRDHAAWQAAWRGQRAQQIPLAGSRDERAGNQSCQYDADAETLRLRLPDAVAAAHGLPKRVILSGVRFPRDPQILRGALARGVAITYRFVREAVTTRSGRDTGRVVWRLYATTEVPDAKRITVPHQGAVGLDMNVDHLAWCRVDASGNPVAWGRIDLAVVGRRRTQVAEDVSAAVAPLVALAARHRVPLVHEDLDLTAKADARRGRHRGTNRKLSSFATTAIVAMLTSKAARVGVAVHAINPAYTSIIGDEKYATGYGRSRHQAAACVIARRGLQDALATSGARTPAGRPRQLRERLRARVASPSASASIRSARPCPVRNRGRHVWSDWGRFARQLAAWEAARRASALRAGGGAPEATRRRRSWRRSGSASSPRAMAPRRT